MLLKPQQIRSINTQASHIQSYSNTDRTDQLLWHLLDLSRICTALAIDLADRQAHKHPPTPDSAGRPPLSPSP